jgi:hypothetical protein
MLASPLSFIHKIEAALPNPYPYRELFLLIWKNLLGPFQTYKHTVSFLPQRSVLNDISRVDCRLGFVGDIMSTYGYPLKFDSSIQDFFLDTDLLVGNLEGIITRLPRPDFSMAHTEAVLKSLSLLRSPDQIALCVANNHSCDFGYAAFRNSMENLSRSDFKVFGSKDMPNYVYKERINISAASMWSNKKDCSHIPQPITAVQKGPTKKLLAYSGLMRLEN